MGAVDCSKCGKRVSNEAPEDLVVRAWVECPECLETDMTTEEEKRFLALAIQGLALRQGPQVFSFALSCAKKLGIEEYLTEYLQSWIDYGQKKEKES